MTKYILNGGGNRTAPDKGKAFFAEMVKGLGHKPQWLFCFYAVPKEVWQEKYDEWSQRVAASLPEVSIKFGMAKPEEFDRQSKQFDMLLIYGGATQSIVELLNESGNVQELLERFKVVGGISAGAIMLSEYAYSCDVRRVVKGQGIVPAKTLVHYQSKTYDANDPRGRIDWEKAYEELKAQGDPATLIYKLHEGEFVIFER